MEENDRLQKQASQLVYENGYYRQQTQSVSRLITPSSSRTAKPNAVNSSDDVVVGECFRRAWRRRTRAATRWSPAATGTWLRRRRFNHATRALLGTRFFLSSSPSSAYSSFPSCLYHALEFLPSCVCTTWTARCLADWCPSPKRH
jgi:hypothetical protein